MYSYIQGKIVDKTFTSIVVDNNGIGYEIGVSGNTLTDIDMGEIVKILGGYDLKTLTVAIASGDSKTLCKIKGLGKKTAELIILSLRDQVADDITLFNDHRDAVTGEDIADAVFALESLGISKTEAVRMATEASKTCHGTEEIIRTCLQKMSK